MINSCQIALGCKNKQSNIIVLNSLVNKIQYHFGSLSERNTDKFSANFMTLAIHFKNNFFLQVLNTLDLFLILEGI